MTTYLNRLPLFAKAEDGRECVIIIEDGFVDYRVSYGFDDSEEEYSFHTETITIVNDGTLVFDDEVDETFQISHGSAAALMTWLSRKFGNATFIHD